MCWKQEWASAIGNIERSIGHVKKAQKKLEKRKEKNDRVLTTFLLHRDRFEEMNASARAQKNEAGIAECKEVIFNLQAEQAQLYKMIQKYGISRRANAYGVSQRKRLKELMGGYRPGR